MLYLLVIGVAPLSVKQPNHTGAWCCFHLSSWSMMNLFSTEMILTPTTTIDFTLDGMIGCGVWRPNFYANSFNWQTCFH